MPEKFVVPQFIDTEDKILGPITVRQFLIMLGAVLIIFIEYKLLAFIYFVLAAAVTALIAGVFAFMKINSQPFHIFFVNFLQTTTRPSLRVWNKEYNETELRGFMKVKQEAPPPPTVLKSHPESTRLRDLTLTVNTGGVYNPEE